ncbi:MAG: type II secretion system protein GspM [Armatimonadota bacterium]
MKLSDRDKRIATIGAAAVVVILLYYFGIEPATRKWRQLSKDIAKQEKLLGQVGDERSVRRRAQDLQERMRQEVTSYVAVEDFDAHMPRMITQLQDFPTYPPVKRLDPMPTQVTETHAKCALSLSFDCGLEQLVAFLYDLQRAQPLLIVDSLRVTINETDPSQLRVRMAVCSFAMLEQEGAG